MNVGDIKPQRKEYLIKPSIYYNRIKIKITANYLTKTDKPFSYKFIMKLFSNAVFIGIFFSFEIFEKLKNQTIMSPRLGKKKSITITIIIKHNHCYKHYLYIVLEIF
jgi:hypothetical protein